MNSYLENNFKKLEIKTAGSDYPSIQNNADIAMFMKKSFNGEILYTNIQNERIKYFVGANNNQPHQNTAFELFYVIQGTMIKIIENKKYIFHAGEGCIINRRITHSDTVQNGFVMILNFTEALFKQITRDLTEDTLSGPIFTFLRNSCTDTGAWKKIFLAFHPTLPIIDSRFKTILDSLQIELASTNLGAAYFRQGLLLRLLAILENHHAFKLKQFYINSNKENYLINQMLSFIEKNYGAISRKEVSAFLHYNDEYLNRLLKKHCGKTINAYAREIRLDRAKELLLTTKLSIAEIAQLLHFSSENYFYHFFAKEAHCSPNQFRQKYPKD